MTETKEKKAEVQIKTGKKTTAQKAFRIAELFVIWAVRSFLYSGCTFCVFLVFYFIYGKASSNELVEVGALVCGIVWPTLLENNQVDKIHGFLKGWLLVSFFIFAINYIVVYRSAFIGVPLSDREETSCAFLLLAFWILSWILCAAVSIYKEVRSVC